MFVMRRRAARSHQACEAATREAVFAHADAYESPCEPVGRPLSGRWREIGPASKIAFDYAVAEPLSVAGGVAMIPGDFGWDDIGDFNSVAALLPSANERNIKIWGCGIRGVSGFRGRWSCRKAGIIACSVSMTWWWWIRRRAVIAHAAPAVREVKSMVAHLDRLGAEDIL